MNWKRASSYILNVAQFRYSVKEYIHLMVLYNTQLHKD